MELSTQLGVAARGLAGCCKSAGRRGCLTGTRETLPPARAPCASWQGPSPLPQRPADPWPAGGQSPRPAPAPPPAGASRPPGRALAFRGAGCTGPGGSVAQGRGKRGAFPVPAQRGNPFPRIGKSFPAGRWSDCFFSTLSDSHFHSRCDFGLSQQLNRCHAGWQGQRWRSGHVTCPSSLNDRRHIQEIGMTFPFTGRGLPMTVAPP
jgi:hypothetical protein